MQVDDIEIHAGEVDFDYRPIRRLIVDRQTRPGGHGSPTIEDANLKLRELAAGLQANAIVGVTYTNSNTFIIHAEGLAVERADPRMACPQCAERIKRAARSCRFCGAEISEADRQAEIPANMPRDWRARKIAELNLPPPLVSSQRAENRMMWFWLLVMFAIVVVLMAIRISVTG